MKKEVVKDPDKEKKILRSSVELFAASGYRETKTDAIAQKAEVSKGLLFHYFQNKQQLYLAAYTYASQFFYERVDYSVWTKAADLTAMVVQATRYKIELQLAYPSEFSFLLRAYSEAPSLPEPLKEELLTRLQTDFSSNLSLINEVVDKMNLRPDVNRQDVIEVLNTLLEAEIGNVQRTLNQHPEWRTIEDLQSVIDQLQRKLLIVEHGFVQS